MCPLLGWPLPLEPELIPHLCPVPFRNLELWTWLQIDFEQCLVSGVKSSLALVKPLLFSSEISQSCASEMKAQEDPGSPKQVLGE